MARAGYIVANMFGLDLPISVGIGHQLMSPFMNLPGEELHLVLPIKWNSGVKSLQSGVKSNFLV
jgi:hypothetical protein